MITLYNIENLAEETGREIMLQPSAYFNTVTCLSDIIDSDDFKRMLYDIEGSILKSREIIITKDGCEISIEKLANGIKNLANHMFLSRGKILPEYQDDFDEEELYDLKNRMIDCSFMGRNVFELIATKDYLEKYHNVPMFTAYNCITPKICLIDINLNNKIMKGYQASNILLEATI